MTIQERSNLVYFYAKAVEACLFFPNDMDVSELLNSANPLESYIVFQTLDIMLDENIHYMDENAKENARRIVHLFKEKYEDISKEDLVKLVNNLLIKINESDDSQIQVFLENQISKRYNDKKKAKQIASKMPFSLDLIKLSILKDFEIIITHSDIKTDAEFDSLALAYSKDNLSYMSSVNAIVSEYPGILNNPLFVKRLHIVSSNITSENIDSKIKKMHKKFKKIS